MVGKKGGQHLLRQQDTKELSLIQGEGGCHTGRPRGKSIHPAERHQNKKLPLGPRYWLLGEAPEFRGREGGHGMGAEGGSLSTQPGWGEALRSEAASSLPAWTSLPGGAAPPC